MNKGNQKLSLKDGRTLGFAEYGTSAGKPVFHFHGSGSSRLDRPASHQLLEQLDICFISVDRPGHGLSDFQPGRCLLDWPNDIAQLADHLGLEIFYVTGHSAGGPHALACAYLLPERVKAAAVISSVAPMNRPNPYKGMPILNQLLARSARQFPELTHLVRKFTRGMILQDAEKTIQQFMDSIPDADKAVLYEPENVSIVVSSLREGFRQGAEGIAHDDILINREWGFEIKAIQPHIDIWHGQLDVNVPFHAGEYLHNHIPHNRFFALPDQGHFFIVASWEEVLSKLILA